ncbi:uncharacterized protein LOC125033473 [Penaeus chinensis]|uniref:uncharacterized protein LOC125033473 n=1 Tax=Penaeus chinensis TaxID=139456 RepID=UPI001FB5D696|nr:uncharacterized protein LOC125033473 [Penaeus chinensis]XP_047480958.1 uncharacterized protein LOC125033473 [Penaeus chinensis]
MAAFVLRSGSKEAPQWCFRPRFLGFLTLLLLVLAHSTSAGVVGRERTNDTDTQEGRYGHSLNGDEEKHHYTDKYDYGDMHHHDNASLDDIVPEAHTNENIILWKLLWMAFVVICIVCCQGARQACSKYKDDDGPREGSRVVLIRRHILVSAEDPAASQTRCDRDSGAATIPSAGTEHPADDAPPAYSDICPEASRTPQ